MPKRQLSAKDKAFQEERQRLTSRINYLEGQLIARDKELRLAQQRIKELEADVELLESKVGISAEELRKHIVQTASLNAMLKPLFDMRGIY